MRLNMYVKPARMGSKMGFISYNVWWLLLHKSVQFQIMLLAVQIPFHLKSNIQWSVSHKAELAVKIMEMAQNKLEQPSLLLWPRGHRTLSISTCLIPVSSSPHLLRKQINLGWVLAGCPPSLIMPCCLPLKMADILLNIIRATAQCYPVPSEKRF